MVSMVSLAKSASDVLTLCPWCGGLFLLGESRAACAVTLTPL